MTTYLPHIIMVLTMVSVFVATHGKYRNLFPAINDGDSITIEEIEE